VTWLVIARSSAQAARRAPHLLAASPNGARSRAIEVLHLVMLVILVMRASQKRTTFSVSVKASEHPPQRRGRAPALNVRDPIIVPVIPVTHSFCGVRSVPSERLR